jgi:molybdate transport repressor ModE-like protein
MKTRGIHLQYTFGPPDQRGAEVQNPLFDLLSAVREHGSIQQAAKALGASYRHVWGSLKQWEEAIGEPLVVWTQGQPARLTPFAERLLWAETRARTRMTPHIEALRAELERVLTEALDGSQHVLTIYASHDLALCVTLPVPTSVCTSTCASPAASMRCGRWPKGAAWWPASTCRASAPQRRCSRMRSSRCSSRASTS